MEKRPGRGLVARAIGGDTGAFETLYRQYSSAIVYQTRRFISNPDEADDAAQEAVLEMYKGIGKLQNPDAFVPWMYRLTRFVCLKHMRRLGTMGRGYYQAADIDEYAESLPDERHEHDPARRAEMGEQSAQIMQAIGKLPEKQREALVLYYYEGMNYREIAEAIGGTTSTVSTNIMKAKRNIAKDLEPAIALAISADAGAKLAGFDFAAFHHVCDLAIGKAAAIGAGVGSSGAGQGHGNAGTKQVALASLAAAVIIAIVALVDASGELPPAPVPPEPVDAVPEEAVAMPPVAEPAPPYVPFVPTAEIMFEGGDCECGHVNPSEARLELSREEGLVKSWTIISQDGAELFSGDGTSVMISELLAGADGEYAVWFEAANDEGVKATLSREFLILGHMEPDVIYQ